MSKIRFASAASFIVLGSMIAGCAAPQTRVTTSGFGGRAGGEVGLATRALAALNANDIPTAIDFAERAVEKTPDDAGFRALLGNAYFAAGRFASAEAAYKDALSIYSAQPQVVLKLALVEIAQGKNAEAVDFLNSAQPILDAADYGLALALAGRPSDAVQVLQQSARATGADGRVRQNLALAYALAGDWTNARVVASQDIVPDQLDGRIQQWMQLATPTHSFDQVAALTGVTPAATDPGQPTRLALRPAATKQAVAAPAPAAVAAPVQQVAEAAPAPAQQFAVAAPVAPEFVAPAPPPEDFARVAAAAADAAPAPAFVAEAPQAIVEPQLAALTVKLPPVRSAPAVLRTGKSSAVVQLGAFGSRERVAAAWEQLTKRYPKLKAYSPMTARFDSPKGTVYRLSIKGFGSQREAVARCSLLKSRGGACFVRNVAGDAPIQFASR
jgi:Flp pilus assembly protein TadD